MTTSEDPPASDSPAEVTKASIRKDTWAKLQADSTVTGNIYLNRIPYFKGSDEAAQRFAETEEFKNAKSICINADKAQESVQYLTVQAKKTLLIQIPLFIRKGLVKCIQVPDDLPDDQVQKLTTRTAIGAHGKVVPLSDERKVDIVVMGSIAVTKQGQRIGKGEGFADIEYAMMQKQGMLTPDTIVVTTVHDSQVFDSLPGELFKEHDVGVNLIVTPTQVIRVSPNPPKSSGLNWSLLSNRRLKIFPILRQLREKDVSAGDTSELKEDSDVESRPRRPRRLPPRHFRSRPRSSTGGDGEVGEEHGEDQERTPRPRRARRPRQSKSEGDEEGGPSGTEGEGTPRKPRRPRRFPGQARFPGQGPRQRSQRRDTEDGQEGEPRPRRFGRGRPRLPVDFSLRVGNIASDVRVRDLKTALAECKVKPVNIKWFGQNGFALLHFARMEAQAGDAPANNVDGVLTALRDLKLAAAEGDGVTVEPLTAPVTRIEVTNEITAV
ncbi:methenyltetrahydrofolate synthase domain-containing protein [Thrips palmi]|uniref:Methenyltetrahydrofolate synthase domain-containing protein n=1 Tax=Thrips palmi TaxID=161013 RepID=A0A6P9AAJ9_THRPL|nr:methenyltetrahydrofolate synthase domain-containing protein [Thrips palmi]